MVDVKCSVIVGGKSAPFILGMIGLPCAPTEYPVLYVHGEDRTEVILQNGERAFVSRDELPDDVLVRIEHTQNVAPGLHILDVQLDTDVRGAAKWYTDLFERPFDLSVLCEPAGYPPPRSLAWWLHDLGPVPPPTVFCDWATDPCDGDVQDCPWRFGEALDYLRDDYEDQQTKGVAEHMFDWVMGFANAGGFVVVDKPSFDRACEWAFAPAVRRDYPAFIAECKAEDQEALALMQGAKIPTPLDHDFGCYGYGLRHIPEFSRAQEFCVHYIVRDLMAFIQCYMDVTHSDQPTAIRTVLLDAGFVE